MTPLGIFRKVIENVIPILEAMGTKLCVIIPPPAQVPVLAMLLSQRSLHQRGRKGLSRETAIRFHSTSE
jgi:hypothetical protein